MYLQIQNTTKKSFNIIRSTKQTLTKDIKQQGWKAQDCKIIEIPEALITTVFRGADGKNYRSSKEYLVRAKSKGKTNTLNNLVKKEELLSI